MILQRYVDTFTGMYDFAVSGGAIGSFDLQIPIPTNFVVTGFCVVPITTPLAGAGATISFDVINNTTAIPTVTVGGLMPATLFSVFSTPTLPRWGIFGPGITIAGNAGAYAVLASGKLTFPLSVGMSIAVNSLTAGKIQVIVQGVGFDI